jgi:hypothetical protein
VARTAQRVREAITDIGAQVVTVREADAESAQEIAAAIGEAMLLDAPYAVMVTEGTDIGTSRISQGLGAVLENPALDVTEFEEMAGVVLIVVDGGSALRKLFKSMRKWAAAPRVVNVGPAALDIDTEVILDVAHGQQNASGDGQEALATTFRSRQPASMRLGA